MPEKTYICGYKHCLHPNIKVQENESVLIGKRYYHTDCAELRRNIKECADLYIENIDDKTIYPTVTRIINYMIFKNRVPVNYIKNEIQRSQRYYSGKPAMILYGIRKKFYKEMEKELNYRR